jgi:hypothetical protein
LLECLVFDESSIASSNLSSSYTAIAPNINVQRRFL